MSENEQESEKHETVADIVAELRKESEKVRTVTRPDGYGGYEEITLEGNPYLKNLADRVETAWKRESRAIATEHAVLPAECITKPSGDAAETRKALKELDKEKTFCERNVELGIGLSLEGLREHCRIVRQILNAALSAPARNCDVGTAEEQGERCMAQFDQWRRKGDGKKLITAIMAWTQMPYEQEGGAK